MRPPILLAADLDRTVVPNGPQPESPEARPRLRAVAARPEVTLAYVTGRHEALAREAIAEWELPAPELVIGDVGTTIYRVEGEEWTPWGAWQEAIAPDWGGRSRGELARVVEGLLAGHAGLAPQEEEKQGDLKLSWYAPTDLEPGSLVGEIRDGLEAEGVRARVIWSVDEALERGLLDVLPASASKLHALEFAMDERAFVEERTVFAGDSGNDLSVLTSGLRAVLVANARDVVRAEAILAAQEAGRRDRLYLARGGFLGMNGNYAAGVLEGLAHFLPETEAWMR